MKIVNDTQADWIGTIKAYKDAFERFSIKPFPTHIKNPDGTNYKLEELFKALEEYKKNEIKSDKVKKVK